MLFSTRMLFDLTLTSLYETVASYAGAFCIVIRDRPEPVLECVISQPGFLENLLPCNFPPFVFGKLVSHGPPFLGRWW